MPLDKEAKPIISLRYYFKSLCNIKEILNLIIFITALLAVEYADWTPVEG